MEHLYFFSYSILRQHVSEIFQLMRRDKEGRIKLFFYTLYHMIGFPSWYKSQDESYDSTCYLWPYVRSRLARDETILLPRVRLTCGYIFLLMPSRKYISLGLSHRGSISSWDFFLLCYYIYFIIIYLREWLINPRILYMIIQPWVNALGILSSLKRFSIV